MLIHNVYHNHPLDFIRSASPPAKPNSDKSCCGLTSTPRMSPKKRRLGVEQEGQGPLVMRGLLKKMFSVRYLLE